MFTGIVTDRGRIAVREDGGDTRLVIETAYKVEEIDLGASISCSGCCLTVVETGRTDAGTGWFAVEASTETLSKTTLDGWTVGTRINLERALRLGDELGGHFVLGHVDGIAKIMSRDPEGDSLRFTFLPPEPLRRYIAPKGSVVLDGVSLTVNEVNPDGSFGVNIIPHTAAVTGFGEAGSGDFVNLEVDALARYVARLLGKEG
ncbi:riboflavin synthase [Rhodospirillaceae bacterium KN72]|uniref:Riboflavin synthase n=1 Tax=Pacificispira spongiicola TaxID=2729598 RepID=A0A7Y0HG58_9PROT|nr:riboflavin synthase [Pacificispira spongiicola]NMM44004.1 riboflavin synthase [Pacificispira spongiicola]